MNRKVLFLALVVGVAALVTAASGELVTDGLIIQLKADAIIGLSDGDPVNSWPDSATSDTVDGTVTPYTAYTPPIYKPNVIGGMPVVRLTRDTTTETNSTVMSSAAWTMPAPANGCTYFAVFTPSEGAGFARMFHVGATTAGSLTAIDVADPAASGRTGFRYNNGFSLTTVANSPLVVGNFHIGVWQMGQGATYGTGMFYAIDDLFPEVYDSNNPNNVLTYLADGNYLAVGGGYNGPTSFYPGDYYGGDVAEILIYNSMLTEEQMGQTSQYLRDKYFKTRAWDYSPTMAAQLVDPAAVTALTWSTARNPNNTAELDPRVVQHFVYLTDVLTAEGDPDWDNGQSWTVTELNTPSQSVSLGYGATYYWRVDESLLEDGLTSGPQDPNTVTGFVGVFGTMPSAPVVVTDPENVLRWPSTDPTYEGDAVFTCVFDTLDPTPIVEWFQEPNDPVNLLDSDISVATVADVPEVGLWTSTLTIQNIEEADETAFYCKVTDDSAGLSTASASADLGIRRLKAWWPLDLSLQYVDASGQGYGAEPNIAPDTGQWIPGADPTETNEGLDLVPQPQSAGYAGEWAVSAYTGQITASAWVKWAGNNTSFQGVVSNRTLNTAAQANFTIEIRPNNNIQLYWPGLTALEAAPLPVGEWAHVAATAGSDGLAFYVNGELAASRTGSFTVRQNDVGVCIGAIQRSDTGRMLNPLNGAIDDVRLFNYAKTHAQVVDLYYEILEIPVCLNPEDPSLNYDMNGDCVIDLVDFAEFISDWLLDGFCPGQGCP